MNDERSPEEIEREIETTRARMGDTIDALQAKMSPGQMMDSALGYLRGPNDYVNNLGRSLRDNPLPVALIAIGIGWLMVGGGSGPQRRPYYYSSRADYPTTQPTDTYGSTGTYSSTGAYGSSTTGEQHSSGRMHAAADSARHSASAAGARLSETAARAQQGLHDTAAGARARMSQAGAGARHAASAAGEQVSHMAAGARHQMEHLGNQAYYGMRRAQSGMSYMLQEQPLLLGAVGLLIGAAIGAALPPTRREDEWMGEYRDDMLEQARETGAEHLEKARHIAEAALNEASHEAERQGITPEAAGEAGRNQSQRTGEQVHRAEEKASNVAGAAWQGAKDEASRQGYTTKSNGSDNPTSRT